MTTFYLEIYNLLMVTSRLPFPIRRRPGQDLDLQQCCTVARWFDRMFRRGRGGGEILYSPNSAALNN